MSTPLQAPNALNKVCIGLSPVPWPPWSTGISNLIELWASSTALKANPSFILVTVIIAIK